MSVIVGYFRAPNNLRSVPAPTSDAVAFVDGNVFEWNNTSTATADDVSVVAVTGVTTGRWIRNYGGAVEKLSVTVGHADLTASAVSQSIAIGTIPAGSRVVGVSMHTYTPFTGGSVSACVLDIGSTGDVDAIVDGANVFAAAVDGQPSTFTAGINPNKYFADATAIAALFIATGDNVVNLTAGAVTIDVMYTVISA